MHFRGPGGKKRLLVMTMWPKGLWSAMVDIQNRFFTPERPISLKEVEITLIRQMLIERFGFKCDHPQQYIKEKENRTVFCSWCWTFLDVIKPPKEVRYVNEIKVIPGVYRRRRSFLDQKLEQEQEEALQLSKHPMSSIIPDNRGGE